MAKVPGGQPPPEGFPSPNYTQVPDLLFDYWLPELSHAELKVLLYIIRRTLGFKKDADNISLKQMVKGITTRDGRVLDRGTGLSEKSVTVAVKSLEEKKLIIAERRSDAHRGDLPTTYGLNIRWQREGSETISDGEGKNLQSPSEAGFRHNNTVIQETERQETVEGSNREEDASIIRQVTVDICRELGDEAPERSTSQRAVNLWQQSGLSRAEFVKLIYRARHRTREYQGKQPPGTTIRSKPAYFFEIIENTIAE